MANNKPDNQDILLSVLALDSYMRGAFARASMIFPIKSEWPSLSPNSLVRIKELNNTAF